MTLRDGWLRTGVLNSKALDERAGYNRAGPNPDGSVAARDAPCGASSRATSTRRIFRRLERTGTFLRDVARKDPPRFESLAALACHLGLDVRQRNAPHWRGDRPAAPRRSGADLAERRRRAEVTQDQGSPCPVSAVRAVPEVHAAILARRQRKKCKKGDAAWVHPGGPWHRGRRTLPFFVGIDDIGFRHFLAERPRIAGIHNTQLWKLDNELVGPAAT